MVLVVDYYAGWAHEFFGIIDGAVTTFRVATIPVDSERTFAVAVPDLANDPVVRARFVNGARKERGEFGFHLRSDTRQTLMLEDVLSPSVPAHVVVASEYPRPITLRRLP